MQSTFKISISGQVQGVGFRPFIFNLAQEFNLNGTVYNDENGVEILINAQEKIAQTFLQTLLNRSPRVSKIQGYNLNSVPLQQFKGFSIQKSKESEKLNIPLTPDFAICDSCIQDIRDTTNRRFGYPFTTCTSCGPRYSITEKFPFDRGNTSLSDFKMCPQCSSEYESFEDRRFHSQTNSCWVCGIELELEDATGNRVVLVQKKPLETVADYLKQGHIIAIKNTNGYMLCCDANNAGSIENLRSKKQRPTKPFALLYPNLQMIKSDFQLTQNEEDMLTSQVGPIVLLKPKSTLDRIKTDQIAPELDQYGVMLPSTALLSLLMSHIDAPIIATSGNIHGSPILATKEAAMENLASVADYFLHHNLDIHFAQDDSVLRFVEDNTVVLRRSRGLAPNYLVDFPTSNKTVLAMGAHLKSTFALQPNSHVYISQYFGNLDNYDVYQRYHDYILKFTSVFDTVPEVLLVDEHKHYQSTLLGLELSKLYNAKVVSVQHHKAHFASVLGEHGLFDTQEKIMGVIWDGTGLGSDGNIWGGEFFGYHNHQMERLVHFEYVPWIAGDKMAKEPRLSLLSMMDENPASVASKFSEIELRNYQILLKKNKLKTSSVGRLFDAVASLLDLKDITTYEGEAAMILETTATRYKDEETIDFLEDYSYGNIPTSNLIHEIYRAKEHGKSKEIIACSFICTLAHLILKLARHYGYTTVACSGGVFQNALLVKKLWELGRESGVKLIFNRILSSNDENIAFGQLCHYHHIKN
jgi:hydrogenase maturation protein HypF